MEEVLVLQQLLGPKGPGITRAMSQAMGLLESLPSSQLLQKVGTTFDAIDPFQAIDKSALQDSYGGAQAGPTDDFLVGRGLFYFSEQRRLFLDCTAGHYQMLWGYNHPVLRRIIEEGTRAGIVWDNHSNIPQAPVKQLAHRLVSAANPPGDADPLDTALLGVCTGSVACAAAIKIQLKVYEQRQRKGTPILVVLAGNYHGTDMVAQCMRGLWPGLVQGVQIITVEPNNSQELEHTFREHGARIAGFWAEPVLMNREAIAVHAEFLQLARRWCDDVGALLCFDEIQSGFWQPEVFAFRALGLRPDLVVVGKGMTAGVHPLAAVLYKERYDVLAQYDAISTNGSASMPALVALGCMELIGSDAPRIQSVGRRIEDGFAALASDFPEQLQSAQGRGHLAGLKFRRVQDALDFHRKCVASGLWVRAHAYHEGHSTVLTKLGLLADDAVVDFVLARFRELLTKR